MRAALVNFADKKGWFQDGARRLFQTFKEHGFDFDPISFTDVSQLPACPPHSEVPYAFKVAAIRYVWQFGYEQVFYADSSIYATASVAPVLAHWEMNGYYLETTEHNLGVWCSDSALVKFGVDRETAFRIPTIVAGCVAFDFSLPVCREIITRWYEHSLNGSFCGSWTNEKQQVSKDPRVRGHRHDQSALSAVAHHMQLKLLPFETFIYYGSRPPTGVFHCHPTI